MTTISSFFVIERYDGRMEEWRDNLINQKDRIYAGNGESAKHKGARRLLHRP